MKIYELDGVGAGDDWVETLYFPDCSVTMQCNWVECQVVTSSWKNVTGRDKKWIKPATEAKMRLKAYAFIE